jgi:hypothetical protein
MSALCISGRNGYSKGAIQLDFASSVKELDQENSQEKDEETFNPDEDIRNYDEVARPLPVFCCSSKAYQKMSGRLVRDAKVPGLRTPEDRNPPTAAALQKAHGRNQSFELSTILDQHISDAK